MKRKIISLLEYSSLKEAHFFDLDDTLFLKKIWWKDSFEDNRYIPNNHFHDYISKACKSIGITYDKLTPDINKIMVLNVFGQENEYFSKAGKHLIMKEPKNLNSDKYTLSNNLNNNGIKEIYLKSKNKAIITARPPILKGDIEEKLLNNDLNVPNLGIYCYPYNYHKDIGIWKGKTINEICKENSIGIINFYEDNKKWLLQGYEENKDKIFNGFLVKKENIVKIV